MWLTHPLLVRVAFVKELENNRWAIRKHLSDSISHHYQLATISLQERCWVFDLRPIGVYGYIERETIPCRCHRFCTVRICQFCRARIKRTCLARQPTTTARGRTAGLLAQSYLFTREHSHSSSALCAFGCTNNGGILTMSGVDHTYRTYIGTGDASKIGCWWSQSGWRVSCAQ